MMVTKCGLHGVVVSSSSSTISLSQFKPPPPNFSFVLDSSSSSSSSSSSCFINKRPILLNYSYSYSSTYTNKSRSRDKKTVFRCRCNTSSNNNNNNNTTEESESCNWDWNRWTRHFSDIEQAHSFASLLKFQLEDAVDKEDFLEAARLKKAIAEATSKDTVAQVMSQLKKAIEEENYQDASRLCRYTGSGLVGWWVGYSKDSDDPFGRLVRITPSMGRFVAKTYTPRQLVTSSPGSPLFEIFVVKEANEEYVMQVVYLQRPKKSSANSTISLSKPTRSPPMSEVENPSELDIQENEVKAEISDDDKGINVEAAAEEGIKSVINFLKDKIPGLKVKVLDIDITSEVIDESELIQDDADKDGSSEDEADILEEIQADEASDIESIMEDGKNLETKLFIGGVMHNNDDTSSSKDEYVRLSAEIKDMERDSFELHIPKKTLENESAESKVSKVKVAAIAAQGVSELMPPEVAKAFLVGGKVPSKVSTDMREIVKLAVSQAQKRSRLSEHTTFSRISTSNDNLDPFEEVVQLRRKYGHWNASDNISSDVEFFEYVEAVKLTGDLNVPAGQVTFRAKIGKGSRNTNRGMYPEELGVVASYKGQGRIAEFGFKNPKWVEGELLQLNGKGMGPYVKGADLGFLYIVPEQSFLVLFNRLQLPD
ncbi:hypothetical protein ACFE04_028992 [Oxalis oulophora]